MDFLWEWERRRKRKEKKRGKKGKKEVSADNNYMKKHCRMHRKTRPHTSTKGIPLPNSISGIHHHKLIKATPNPTQPNLTTSPSPLHLFPSNPHPTNSSSPPSANPDFSKHPVSHDPKPISAPIPPLILPRAFAQYICRARGKISSRGSFRMWRCRGLLLVFVVVVLGEREEGGCRECGVK